MKHDNALLEKLTRSSLRLNKGLMVLLGLALLLVGTSFWSFQRLIEEQHDSVRLHFARLMENIQEQERFLQALIDNSVNGELLSHQRPPVHLLKALPEEGPDIYLGQVHSFSMPFSVKLDQRSVTADETAKVLGQGANLANFYSTFWSASYYQSPQVFLFDPQGNYDITVPAAGRGRGKVMSTNAHFQNVFNTVVARMPDASQHQSNNAIVWESYVETPDYTTPAYLLAYIRLQLKPEHSGNDANARVSMASLVDLSQINDFERIMDRSVFDRFTLVAPSGKVLVGTLRPESPLHEGFNLKSDGLVFKLVKHEAPGWLAIYTVSFKGFFHYAFWPLSGLAVTILGIIGLGLLANRWYKQKVIQPASLAHERIAESEAFSRAVIDIAPTGLCAVRRSDHQVLVENQRAQLWQGTRELVDALDHHEHSADSDEDYLEINGRHLRVGYVATRYQGQDVRLYAFNDVTRHIEDAKALEQARRAADAANEAKTLFLATMSHEIRTPLYGVLGTLELLALTHLQPRQQAYLQTIQRSSVTLFQLISDVLDVSKIESGQMAIEPTEFCPLDLLEDTLNTYTAAAQRKGLLLYACTDADLPGRLLGDPLRIRQILNNLLNNAIKFTDSGRVVLRTRILQHSTDHVSLEWQVTDTGIGIDQAQQNKLFELFYQVKDASSEGGAGLGLPICRWLSEKMGGQMKMVSEPGLGSSFTLSLSLPVLDEELPDCSGIETDLQPVYIRAPIQELAQHYCDWLERLGMAATLAIPAPEQRPAQALLLEVMPCTPEQPWSGLRIYCTRTGRNAAEFIDGRWEVGLHDIRAIARSISLARRGFVQSANTPAIRHNANLQLHVLVAEDNPINQAILKEQLEALGCSAVVTSNGEQALNLWQPETYDLVITDVNMPIINGYELAKALRLRDARVPIIGVTANAMREEGQRCLAVGMNAWIVKPLNLQTLRAQLIKLCRSGQPHDTTSIEPEALSSGPRPLPSESPHLSPDMRTLFISTMQEDMHLITAALERGDTRMIGERLHSIAGALAAVQVPRLAERCADLENLLSDATLDVPLKRDVDQVLQRLAAIMDNLE
ncbi:response regulator [Pseudomonas sp.]|uniref:hybrid sensor histidine kinase/response regulator n=1 Tax=Pseudomonas sp. TaxID=306 RepID=UPI003BAE3959